MKKYIGILIGLIAVALLVSMFLKNDQKQDLTLENNLMAEKEPTQNFINSGLRTNTSISSIPLDQILSGGPPKDGIPSINDPKFISISEASEIENPDQEGLSVVINGEAKFYPYTILVWHEIVNDTVGNTPVSVTFCPLCGSGIVYERTIDDKEINFGVSGRLWQSNLLMYDSATESLWSQAAGHAVVGEKTGTELVIVDSQLIPFSEFATNHPDGVVLSRDTGHNRSYGVYPYGDYEEQEGLLFAVSIGDRRFFSKEMMYVVNTENQSVAFVREQLIEAGGATMETDSGTLSATVDGSSIVITDEGQNVLPGYHEMWFSWSTHHQEDGVVWSSQ